MSSRNKYGLTGLSWHDMKKYPHIVPTLMMKVGGGALAASYLFRLATKHPEVTWNSRSNPEPWNDYSRKQYRFFANGRDYSKGTPAPRYK